MIIGRIEFHGRTLEDALDAVAAAMKDVAEGYSEGRNHWEGAGYALKTVERPEDVPRETSSESNSE